MKNCSLSDVICVLKPTSPCFIYIFSAVVFCSLSILHSPSQRSIHQCFLNMAEIDISLQLNDTEPNEQGSNELTKHTDGGNVALAQFRKLQG